MYKCKVCGKSYKGSHKCDIYKNPLGKKSKKVTKYLLGKNY